MNKNNKKRDDDCLMRQPRKQPFCWQEKKINRLIRKIYKEDPAKMSKMILLYQTLTEMDSDFNGKNINYYTASISTYSWLSIRFIPSALEELEELKIIKIVEKKVNWKFAWKELIFTPDNVIDLSEKIEALEQANITVSRLSTNGEKNNIKYLEQANPTISRLPTNGDTTNESSTVVENTPLEDIYQSENIINKNNNNEKEKLTLLLFNNWIKDKKIIQNILDKNNSERIYEVINECNKKERDNPSWFIIAALSKKWEFNNTNKSVNNKYEEQKQKEKLEEDRKIAQQLKSNLNKKIVDDWIVNNKSYYQELLQKEKQVYEQKSENSKFQPKDPSLIIISNVRSFIKKDILWI